MAEQDTSQERTEEPTPRRLQKAKEKGQIARSRELGTMGVLLVGGTTLLLIGGSLVRTIVDIAHLGLQLTPEQARDPARLLVVFEAAGIEALVALMPFFVMVTLVAVLSHMALGGWSFAATAMAFKWEKMDPVKGLKRVFGPKGLMELAKALGKFLVVLGVAVWLLWWQVDHYLALSQMPPEAALAETVWIILVSFLVVAAALVVVAAVDVPFQLWDHKRQLKMTRQEVKDEYKDTEGKPEVKQKIRQLQREMAQRRMMEDVPKADVVVTNPTHFAVALRYDQQRAPAPVLVAKGSDRVATRIRELAAEHDVPRVEAPLLARALYHSTEIGQEIPQRLYVAVAQVLAYCYRLRTAGSAPPLDPESLDVPEDMAGPGRR
jgi:flagellar biosynthetic protein FlhB